MNSLILSWSDQLMVGGFWLLTLATAYLRGANHERDRHIAALESQIAFMRQWVAGEDEPSCGAIFSGSRTHSLNLAHQPRRQAIANVSSFSHERLSRSVGFNANRHMRGQTQNAGIPFQVGA